MKGKLTNKQNEWVVVYEDIIRLFPFTQYGIKELTIHPDDVEQIRKDSLIFDNIEARIAAYPEVDFEIVDLDNGAMSYTEGHKKQSYAKLIPIKPYVSDDFQIGPDGAYEYTEDEDNLTTKDLQEEPKQETLEEAAKKLAEVQGYDTILGVGHIWIEGFQYGANWQAKRMYSEEDMRLAFETGRNFQLTGEDNFNELIETFKKK